MFTKKRRLRRCVECNDPFIGYPSSKYCSRCKKEKVSEVFTRECEYCGEEFTTTRTNQVFCCRAHRQAHRTELYKKGAINVSPNR